MLNSTKNQKLINTKLSKLRDREKKRRRNRVRERERERERDRKKKKIEKKNPEEN